MSDLSERLRVHCSNWAGVPFVLGRTDCMHFVTRWIDSESNRATQLEKTAQEELGYTTVLGYMRVVEKAGGMEALAKQYFGHPLNSVGDAQLGDIAVFKTLEDQDALGIICGPVVLAVGMEGVWATGIDRVVSAWELPKRML